MSGGPTALFLCGIRSFLLFNASDLHFTPVLPHASIFFLEPRLCFPCVYDRRCTNVGLGPVKSLRLDLGDRDPSRVRRRQRAAVTAAAHAVSRSGEAPGAFRRSSRRYPRLLGGEPETGAGRKPRGVLVGQAGGVARSGDKRFSCPACARFDMFLADYSIWQGLAAFSSRGGVVRMMPPSGDRHRNLGTPKRCAAVVLALGNRPLILSCRARSGSSLSAAGMGLNTSYSTRRALRRPYLFHRPSETSGAGSIAPRCMVLFWLIRRTCASRDVSRCCSSMCSRLVLNPESRSSAAARDAG